MRRLLSRLGLLTGSGLLAAQEPAASSAADAHAFLEVTAARDRYFVQEPIQLTLRIGFDPRFFEEHALQLFRRHLDVPLQVEASWLEELPGTVFLEDDPRTTAAGRGLMAASFVLNERVVEAARSEGRFQDGRPCTLLELEKSCLPVVAGKLVVPAPVLRFTDATRFEEDLLQGRVALDRHDAVIHGTPLTLQIDPLPEAGRPPGFTGAVGRFSVAATVDRPRVRVGESFRLALRIDGEGNLEQFDPPALSGLDGFHIYGRIDEKSRQRRTLTWDVTPLRADVTEVPPIPFAFFDPGPPARYDLVQTSPIPLEVQPRPANAQDGPEAEDPSGRAVAGENDLFDLKPVFRLAVLPHGAASNRLSPLLLFGSLLLPWLLALLLLAWLRAREKERRDPDRARARGAAAAFMAHGTTHGLKQGAEPATNVADAFAGFAEYLGARLRCPTASVIAPDLEERLAAAGVPHELAARATALLEELQATRYRGSASAGEPSVQGMLSARKLVDELEASFRKAGKGR